jgi:sugar transferase (PEP-CTERM/EpsH1 system associated)
LANILYLVHRLPYPPNKGDKVRSYHLLKHLCRQHRVHLGTFIDDPEDSVHLPTLQALCASVHAVPLNPRTAKLASVRGLLLGQPLTLPYYRHARMSAWVKQTLASQSIDWTVVFSSCMAQYTDTMDPQRVLVDFVDVDSAKWTDYAPEHRWPLSWLYRREGALLLAYERKVAARARHSFFATAKEAALFVASAPESAGRVSAMNNGVDASYFTPEPGRASPFPVGEVAIVFTGAMDYWPNVDAVTWFVREALPTLRSRHTGLRFHIVGRSPTPAVQALAGEAVNVTGTVPDVRPYLQHAAVVVAPLRLARGIQNKVLEAMAMARPVIAARACTEALLASPGQDVVAADSISDYVQAIEGFLADPEHAERVGHAGRQCVLARYDWSAHLSGLDHFLARPPSAHPPPAGALPSAAGLQP